MKFHWLDGEVSELEVPAEYLERDVVRLDRARQPSMELRGSLVITDTARTERGEFVLRDGAFHQKKS